MGLLKAGVGALGGVLADQWRDFYYCDSIGAETLAKKGQKRTGKRSSNTKGEENIITNGAIIAVNDGQCMIIVEQGKIVEVCAQPGEFVYDTSTEPSIFYGNLGEGIKKSFAELGKRFTFGGIPATDQRIYYFNTKEIIGNKYGTPSPIPFRVVDNNVGLDVDISIRCHGEYTYKIADPLLFYKNVCGNVESEYGRDNIDSQLKSELLTALQPAFAKISEMGIRYSALPAHALEIGKALKEVLTEKWNDIRGIELCSFGVSSANASEDDEKMIKELQRNAALRNPNMAAAHLAGAQAQAMQDAAKNEGGMGAMGGFFGMNMAQNATGMNAANLFNIAGKSDKTYSESTENKWRCECGNDGNIGNFCSACGKKRASLIGWTCECGAVNKGKFCENCGKAKPANAPIYKCDKCGWELKDSSNPPKFCPECGDVFDERDIK